MSDYKQVLILRKDLNMRKGKMCAQAAHASMAAYLGSVEDPRVKAWISGPFAKICVGVDCEADLVALYDEAKSKGMVCSIIEDAGRTEFGGVPTLTAVAIGPDMSSEIDSITGDLKLL